MAEEKTAQPQTEPQEAEAAEKKASATDWQAKYEAMRKHSREWEQRAKNNQKAADELKKLQDEQLTEQEKAKKRAEEAEAELKELKARAARADINTRIATEKKLPPEVVAMLSAQTEEELEEQASKLVKLMPAYPARTDDGGTKVSAQKSSGELFAEIANKQFK